MAEANRGRYKGLNPPAFMDAEWSWAFFNLTMDNLLDLWGMLQMVIEGVIEDEQENELSKNHITKLNRQFEKYHPILEDFKQALDSSKKIRESFR